MESDSKDRKRGDPVKEEPKRMVASSRRSGRKKPIEEKAKQELPPALLPKFPTQLVQENPVILEGEDENDNSLEKEKVDNHWEEGLMIGDMLKDDDQVDTAEEIQDNTVEKIPPKKVEKIEKTEKTADKNRPSNREKNSGRSEDRIKKKKKESNSLDEKKSNEEKKKEVLKVKRSAEDVSSDRNVQPAKKSVQKSKRAQKKPAKPLPKACPPTNQVHSLTQPPLPSQKAPKPKPKAYPPMEMSENQGIHQNDREKLQKSAVDPQQLPPKPGKKKKKFLKNVYLKTKFWGRKSDCVADPSKEQLSKIYVKAEYDVNNPLDMTPSIDGCPAFAQFEVTDRAYTNHTNMVDIFVNKRPFWLTRKPDDVIPKVRIQLHRPLKQMYLGNKSSILPKWRRTEPFNDPLKDPVPSLMAIDPTIGIDPMDGKKERELNRVCANTFHATIMFEAEKLAWDERQRKGEVPVPKTPKMETARRTPRKDHLLQKSSLDESNRFKSRHQPPLKFILDDQVVKLYNRKHRPLAYPGVSKNSRAFWDGKLTKGKIQHMKKGTPMSLTPLKSSSSTSVTSASEGRKPL